MGLEELQGTFELALEDFNQASQKRGSPQKSITCNDYGIFIDFAGVEVNYSLYSLEDNVEDYLTTQTEKHKTYLRLLQDHRLQTKRELHLFNSSLYSFLERFSKLSQEEIEQKLDQTIAKIAFDKVLKEGGLLGKYFFKEIAVDYTKHKCDEARQKLVNYAESIHQNAKELESLDIDRLQYFRNRNLLWYGKQA
ncbi:MAG: hypothetical protein Q7S55_03095 [Nanoarchaeota archaeon]|nr:hypothetical protein [Nanoarchaeota archaeon]